MEDQKDVQSKNKQGESLRTALPAEAFGYKITETRTFHTRRGSLTTQVVGDSSEEITQYLNTIQSQSNAKKEVQPYQSSFF